MRMTDGYFVVLFTKIRKDKKKMKKMEDKPLRGICIMPNVHLTVSTAK